MFHKEMYGEVDICNEIELTIFTFSDFVCAMPAVAEVFVTRQVILQTFFGTEHFFNKAH